MQIKKNPKVDLQKNSSLYLVSGLCLMLFISWRAIEWKSYEKDLYDYQSLNVQDDEDEEIPITEQIKTPPPPPPPPMAPKKPVLNNKRMKLMAELKNTLKKKGLSK